MKLSAKHLVSLLAPLLCLSSCYPPPPEYTSTPLVTERRQSLYEGLLLMLPEKERTTPAAMEEARWLADTAYKAAAAIARQYDSNFPGWAGNYLVNAHMQDRGLCWHYQHDMYRELVRRPLQFYSIGCCVRDKGTRREHNCVYVTPQHASWPLAWVLDAWPYNGRLQTFNAWELDPDQWADRKEVTWVLSGFYLPGHKYPIEHWLQIAAARKWYHFSFLGLSSAYIDSRWPEAWFTPQHRTMLMNISKGKKEHPNSPVSYE